VFDDGRRDDVPDVLCVIVLHRLLIHHEETLHNNVIINMLMLDYQATSRLFHQAMHP
jgi:hypothetical protein